MKYFVSKKQQKRLLKTLGMAVLIMNFAGCGYVATNPSHLNDTSTNAFGYKIGHDDPQRPDFDLGAGEYGSSPQQAKMVSYKTLFQFGLMLPTTSTSFGRDAVRHLQHYFENTGTELDIDVNRLINESNAARIRYEQEVAEAKRFVESLEPGTYEITAINMNGTQITHEDNKNWSFAVGSYYSWGQANYVTVEVTSSKRRFHIDFIYKLFDAYNWARGDEPLMNLPFFPEKITSTFMGEFHREGLAREYLMNGVLQTSLDWEKDI